MSGAYYNENDPAAAAWLRELIRRNLIAPGEVDTRSIEDVRPVELRGFTQCHFFAGIGGWSAALRLAGWPDHERVWTGSCPCQPLSQAGKGEGLADKRHLWPAWLHLISQCAPPIVFGEQVASPLALLWWDLVSADFDGQGYASAAVDLCAAGISAPHIRQRLYWVADTGRARLEGRNAGAVGHERTATERSGRARGLANADSAGRASWRKGFESLGHGPAARPDSGACGMADTSLIGCGEERAYAVGLAVGDRAQGLSAGLGAGSSDSWASPLHGFWSAADWLGCRDGKWRPVEPGTFPLAHGLPARVGRLRGYGNAIVAPLAAEFIRAYVDVRSAA
jgi:DNA (cytosine-5)-methyltransferase 1